MGRDLLFTSPERAENSNFSILTFFFFFCTPITIDNKKYEEILYTGSSEQITANIISSLQVQII